MGSEPGSARAPHLSDSEHLRAVCYGIGLVGAVCALLVLRAGLNGTAAVLHGREPCFDFNLYYRQARQLTLPTFALGERWFYPPLALVVFWPVAWLPLQVALTLWLALQGALVLGLGLILSHTLAPLPRAPRYAAAFGLTVGSLPLWHCIGAGQVSLLVMLLSLLGLSRSGRSGPALLAGAAAIKVYPLAFALPYLVRLRVDYLRRFVLWIVGLGVLAPALALPWRVNRLLWQRLSDLIAGGRHLLFDESQSLRALLERLLRSRSIFDTTPAPLLFQVPYLLFAALNVATVIAIVAFSARRLRSLDPRAPLAIAVTLVACTLLVDPGWAHYYVVLGYAQAVLLLNASRPRSLALCVVSYALSSLSLVAVLLQPTLMTRVYELSTSTLSALVALIALWLQAGESPERSASLTD